MNMGESSSSSPNMTYPNGRSTSRASAPDCAPLAKLRMVGVEPTPCLLLAVWAGVLLLTPPVQADQIVVKGANHRRARIIGISDGLLRFRAAEGRMVDTPLGDIELIIVDRGGIFLDYNQAERFLAAGEPQKAAVRFERTLRLASDFWVELIAARLIVANDRAGRLDDATRNFVRVVRGHRAGPAAAARLIPQTMPEKRNARFGRAIKELDGALAADPTDEQRTLLRLVRYEFLRRLSARRAEEVAPVVAVLTIGESIQSDQVYAILLTALKDALMRAVTPERLAALDHAIRDCPDGALPDFLLLKGETLLRIAVTRDDFIRASWPFLRVAVHMADDPRAAEGLLGAARALERLERFEQARALLDECLGGDAISQTTAEKARAALARLRSGVAPPG